MTRDTGARGARPAAAVAAAAAAVTAADAVGGGGAQYLLLLLLSGFSGTGEADTALISVYNVTFANRITVTRNISHGVLLYVV